MADVPWPTTSNPGAAPGEGSGRLINCFSYADGPATRWRPVAGLDAFTTVSPGEVRGGLFSAGLLIVVSGSAALQVDGGGGTTAFEASVAGSGPVTMARNNAFPPQITGVTSSGPFVIVNGVVQPYPTAPAPSADETYTALPQVNDVTFLDGYFLWTTPDGRIFASDLNTTNVNALSVASAEARPDGLLRGIVYGQQFFAFGQETIEVWQDEGTLDFPLARATVIPVGLYGPWAIAGYQDGWGGPLIFVAQDGSVRLLNGYTPQRISTEDIERLIAAVTDPTTLRAVVYTVGGDAFWSLSSPTWTWEFNVTTGQWHERQSYGTTRWRGAATFNAFGEWLAADIAGGALYLVDGTTRSEGGCPLIWGMDSGPVKDFPRRVQIPAAAFDFVLGADAVPGVAPEAMLSWSHDGGRSWAAPLSRTLGMQGQSAGRVTVNRLGLSSAAGTRFRFRVSDPAYSSFAGARVDSTERR